MRYLLTSILLLGACDVGEVGPPLAVGPDAPAIQIDAPPPPSGLRITTNTAQTATGEFAPNNIVAVWIENSQGAFVKTIKRHSGLRTPNLIAWNIAIGNGSDVDALSGASRGAFDPLTIDWDLKNKAGAIVPDGTYTIRMELADSNATQEAQNNQGEFTFIKGQSSQTQTAQTSGLFTGVNITFNP